MRHARGFFSLYFWLSSFEPSKEQVSLKELILPCNGSKFLEAL